MCLCLSGRARNTFALAHRIILPLTSSDVSDVALDLLGDLESKTHSCTIVCTKASQVANLAGTSEAIPGHALLHEATHVFAQFCERAWR